MDFGSSLLDMAVAQEQQHGRGVYGFQSQS